MFQQQFTNLTFSLARFTKFEGLVMDVAIATLISSALVLTNFGCGSSGRAVAAEVKVDSESATLVNPEPLPAPVSTSALDLGEALTVDCLVSTPLIDRKECPVGGDLFLNPELPQLPHQKFDNTVSDRTPLFQFRF